MKKLYTLILFAIVTTFTVFSQEFIGDWEIYKSKENYSGITNYKVFIEYDEYRVKVFNTYEFPAFYDKENHILYFVIDGVGPGSSFVRLTIKNEELQESYLNNGIWTNYGLFKKTKK